MKRKQVGQRYVRDLIVSMFAYIILLTASLVVLKTFDLPWLGQAAISLLPAIPVIFVVLAIMRLLIDSDEFEQRLQLMATALSAAITGMVTFSYGFLENVGFPKFPTFMVFPMLVAFWGIGMFFFGRRFK